MITFTGGPAKVINGGAVVAGKLFASLLVPVLNKLSFTDYLEPFDNCSDYLSRG
jgi:hypothetical protein